MVTLTAASKFYRQLGRLYDDLYVTWQPYGFVCGVVTGLPARDSSNAALT